MNEPSLVPVPVMRSQTVSSSTAKSSIARCRAATRLHVHRRDNLRVLVDALAADGPLRVPIDDAVETVWALTSPELHQLLTRERGWTRRRYCDWLADSLARLLLQDSSTH